MKHGALTVAFLLSAACAQEAAKPPTTAAQPARLTSAEAPNEAALKATAALAAHISSPDEKEEPGVPAPAPVAPVNDVAELDPLARMGTRNLPKIDMTPKKDLKRNSRATLDAALAAGQSASTLDEAVKAMEKRIGKPTWVEEDGKKRVWIVLEGSRCHKLTLDRGGDIDLEVAPTSEWHMLAVGARQNVCSGEIRAGIVGGE